MAENSSRNGTPPISRSALMGERGVTGLRQWGGRLDEEWLRQLRDRTQRYRIYREQSENHAIIGGGLRTTEMLVRQVPWEMTPAGEDNAALEGAEYASGCLFDDMSQSWNDVVAETIRGMLVFGWELKELVYKQRQGPQATPGESSRFTDGKIGWRKMPMRAQETLEHWVFDDSGGLQAMVQRPPTGSNGLITIPIEKALLFRTSHHKGSPEGMSVLRNCYRSWYMQKRIEELQGIGIERDLAGLPVAYVPPEILAPDADAAHLSVLTAIKQLVTRIRRDEQEGVVFPLAYNEAGKELYKLELLSTGGNRQFDTKSIIEHYNREMAISMLVDIILIGHEKLGSFALADSKTSLLGVALGTYLDEIAMVINRHALPRLWRYNGFPQETMPQLTHGDIETSDLNELGQFILRYSQAGFNLDDLSLENEIRRRARLPLKVEGEPVMAVQPQPTVRDEIPEGDE